MRLTGIIDYSMGNFLCIRGFAPMLDLAEISEADTEIQRDLIAEHQGEMERFLSSGEFTFFPEVILCTNMLQNDVNQEKINTLRESVRIGANFKKTMISNINYSTKVYSIKKENNDLAFDRTQTIVMDFNKLQIQKFLRIDGNHRLNAVNNESNYKDTSIPYCLLLFRNDEETDKFCRALFHNINTKQIPLKMEQNYKVIIESELVFTDDILINDPSFRWNFYLTREVLKQIDISYYPAVNNFISNTKFTYFIELFKYLLDFGVVTKDISAVTTVKDQLHEVNAAIQESNIVSTTDNIAILGALSYYKLTNQDKYRSFIKWIKKNNIGNIEKLHMDDVIKIYDELHICIPKKCFLHAGILQM